MDISPISERQSENLKILLTIATFLVVLRHSFNVHIYNPDIYLTGFYNINSFTQLFFNRLTTVAVPTFFFISGYLFYLTYSPNKQTILRKFKGRFKTLLIPYLTWNFLILGVLIVLQYIPSINKFSSGDKIHVTVNTIFSGFFVTPFLGQFWYIRDLIIFSSLAPFIFYLFKSKYLFILTTIILVWFWLPIDISLFSTEGILFFLLGGYVGHSRSISSVFLGKHTLIVLFIYIISSLCSMFISLPESIQFFFPKVTILFGAYFLISAIDLIVNREIRKILIALSVYSFFIYAFHSPLIKIVSKLTLSLFPISQTAGLISFFSIPLLIILISIYVAKFLKIYAEGFYSILTGDRK